MYVSNRKESSRSYAEYLHVVAMIIGGLKPSIVGLLIAATSLGAFFAFAPASYIADTLGRKWCVGFGCCLVIILDYARFCSESLDLFRLSSSRWCWRGRCSNCCTATGDRDCSSTPATDSYGLVQRMLVYWIYCVGSGMFWNIIHDH
jgi:MFS family permease